MISHQPAARAPGKTATARCACVALASSRSDDAHTPCTPAADKADRCPRETEASQGFRRNAPRIAPGIRNHRNSLSGDALHALRAVIGEQT